MTIEYRVKEGKQLLKSLKLMLSPLILAQDYRQINVITIEISLKIKACTALAQIEKFSWEDRETGSL